MGKKVIPYVLLDDSELSADYYPVIYLKMAGMDAVCYLCSSSSTWRSVRASLLKMAALFSFTEQLLSCKIKIIIMHNVYYPQKNKFKLV